MKYIYSLLIVIFFFAISCEPTFEEPDLADVPGILAVNVGNEGGNIQQFNVIYAEQYLDTVFIKDLAADYTKMFISTSLESGCKIEPIEGSPACGTYGDFSAPTKYRVTAPSGNTADWTIVMAEYVEPIGCLADKWTGELYNPDQGWGPDYDPQLTVGVKQNNDCSLLNITFDLWGYGESANVTFKLKLEAIDMDTKIGNVTLLEDAFVTAEGADITFHAGVAGIYNAATEELLLEVKWSGYNSSEFYYFVITPKE